MHSEDQTLESARLALSLVLVRLDRLTTLNLAQNLHQAMSRL